jgi:hypothetical protein
MENFTFTFFPSLNVSRRWFATINMTVILDVYHRLEYFFKHNASETGSGSVLRCKEGMAATQLALKTELRKDLAHTSCGNEPVSETTCLKQVRTMNTLVSMPVIWYVSGGEITSLPPAT